MLTCPHCESDNRYGAIFCRGCGKKLDIIDELTVENIHEKTRGKKRRRRKDKGAPTPKQLRVRSIIVNAVRIAVILLIAFAVYLTQQTPSVSAISTTEGARKIFMSNKRKLRGGSEVTITTMQLNSYIAGLLPKIEGGKAVRFDNLQVALGNEKDKEELAIRMYVRVFGKRMLFQMFGNLEKSDGKIKFSPATFGKVGKLPYPAFLMKLHCKNVLRDLKQDKELFDKLTEAKVKEVKAKRAGKIRTTTALVLKAKGES